jgi:hypothetical protein
MKEEKSIMMIKWYMCLTRNLHKKAGLIKSAWKPLFSTGESGFNPRQRPGFSLFQCPDKLWSNEESMQLY